MTVDRTMTTVPYHPLVSLASTKPDPNCSYIDARCKQTGGLRFAFRMFLIRLLNGLLLRRVNDASRLEDFYETHFRQLPAGWILR